MIEFRDFIPEMQNKGSFFKSATFEQFSEPLKRANEWIENDNIDVINVETVALPNIYAPGEEGTTDVQLRVSGDMSSAWYQFIRIWYKTDNSKEQ